MAVYKQQRGWRNYDGFLQSTTHTPAASLDTGVGPGGEYEADFGQPDASASLLTALVAAQDMTVAGTLEVNKVADARFGRTLLYDASGASTGVVKVFGFDYMGQRMMEQKTLNGTTAVAGSKAFYRVLWIEWTATAGVNLMLGWGAALGLPFRTVQCLAEFQDGVLASTPGTVTAGVLTNPQTATTGDPRGLFTPSSTLVATKSLTGVFRASREATLDPNTGRLVGGLHGIQHYYAG